MLIEHIWESMQDKPCHKVFIVIWLRFLIGEIPMYIEIITNNSIVEAVAPCEY